jgi:hypothetical protein
MPPQQQASLTLYLDGEPYADSTSRLLRLAVEEGTQGAAALSLCLDLSPVGGPQTPAEQRDWDLLADGRFALLHAISVELAVGPPNAEPTARAVVFHGYITGVEPTFGEARVPDSQLEIQALDASCLMHFEERTVAHVGKTDAEIVRQIYASYGFGTDVEATGPVRSPDRGPLVQRTTDAEFIRLLARRNGYEAFVEHSSAPIKKGATTGTEVVGHFHPPRLAGKPQPRLDLMPRETPSLRTLRARWESHRPTVMVAGHIDERTRRLRASRIGQSRLPRLGSTSRADILRKRLAEVLPKRPQTEAVGRQIADVPYDKQELDTLTWADLQEADWLAEADGVVEGLRYPGVLRPRRTVDMSGAGRLLDGTWYVRGLRHRWERDAAVKRYEVDVDLVRNALGGVG